MMADRRLLWVTTLFILSISFNTPEGNGLSQSEQDQSEILTEEEIKQMEAEQMKYVARLRRKSEGKFEYPLNSPDQSIRISLVDIAHPVHRVKRLTFNITKFMWTHHIPYVMELPSATIRIRLRKVLDHIEDHLCVKFFDVGEKINPNKKNWLKDNGFETNAYIKFMKGKGCVSRYGRGNGNKFRPVSPCYSFLSMMHETMHALGALHTQKMPSRDKYITVHRVNIQKNKFSQYQKADNTKKRINFAFFDSASNLLYGPKFFHVKVPTYDFLRPDMGKLEGLKSTKTLFYELNQNYKCKETFCSGMTKDCGPGYLTFVHDRCVCICPDQYNPDTDCTTLVENVEGPKSWPATPLSIYKATECPNGFEEGTIPIYSEETPKQSGIPFATEGNTLLLEVCTRTTPTVNIKWADWPLGSICIGKVEGVPCGLPFVESTFKIKTKKSQPISGSVGHVTFRGKDVTMRFCCHEDAPYELPMQLPTTTPFRLLRTETKCQEVEGMFPIETNIKMEVKTSVHGFKPEFTRRKNKDITHSSCLYIPPVYGCNSIFTLSSSERTAVFSIPKKGSLREGNRRCFYAFQVPPKSRLRLTFNKFSIHPKDKFYVKRFHPWTNPFRVKSDSRPTQIITERNYLFVEFWSYFKEEKQYKGAEFTVDLLLDDEMCYSADLQGSDYAGDKSISELYEECVPWKEATSCPDFPWKYSLILLNSDNKCRNLDVVEMLQPWCYVKVEGAICVRRYCDACNEADPKDLNKKCEKMLDSNSCQDTEFRNKCFKTCKASTSPYDQTRLKCLRPRSQPNLTYLEVFQDSYDVGSKVGVSCGRRSTQIECTTHGWELFDSKCSKKYCIDASQLCQETLMNFPDFCTHEKSQKIARANCKYTCDVC